MSRSYLPECFINFGKIPGSVRGLHVDVAAIGALMVLCSEKQLALHGVKMNTDTGEISGLFTLDRPDKYASQPFRIAAEAISKTAPNEWEDLLHREAGVDWGVLT
jgi:hypothetical protein